MYENGKLKGMLAVFPFAKIKKGNNTETQMESIINVIYNYEGDLIKSSTSYQNDKVTHIDNFIYNTDKQVVQKQTKTEGISIRETKYTYDKKGNLLKEKDLTPISITIMITREMHLIWYFRKLI
jgi:hypothetical protein